MSEKREKTYCGGGKVIQFKNGGEAMRLSFSERDVEILQANLDNGWVNCLLKAKKDQTHGNRTHYVELDDWKPHRMEPAEDATMPF